MSHVVDMQIEIRDLDALGKACKRLGLELVANQKTYKWFGRSVGDYPVPAGFTAAELGKCEHAIRVKGNPNAYEVGVVKRKDGEPGFQLIWDFWQKGFGLQDKIGENGGLLKQNYAAQVAKKQMLREGYRVKETTNRHGDILLAFVD